MRLAETYRKWFVADIFIDVAFVEAGITGLELNRMIKGGEKGNLDIILTKSISGSERDANEGLEAIRKIQSSGKRIIFDKDKIYAENVKEELLISIIETLNQTENEWRRENVRLSLKYIS